MCFGMGCKYEYNFGPHEITGECGISSLLGTDKMPEDAECERSKADEHIREASEVQSGAAE